MDYVLPNRGAFGCSLWTDKDLYKQGTQVNLGCGGDVKKIDGSFYLDQPRYLSNEDQKEVCAVAVEMAKSRDPQYSYRCVMLNQWIEDFTDDLVCTHKLNVSLRLSTDGVGMLKPIKRYIRKRFHVITSALMADDSVRGMCELYGI